jgi:hypothetical protein
MIQIPAGARYFTHCTGKRAARLFARASEARSAEETLVCHFPLMRNEGTGREIMQNAIWQGRFCTHGPFRGEHRPGCREDRIRAAWPINSRMPEME